MGKADRLTGEAPVVAVFVDGVRVATARRIKDARKAAEQYRREVKPAGVVTAMVVSRG